MKSAALYFEHFLGFLSFTGVDIGNVGHGRNQFPQIIKAAYIYLFPLIASDHYVSHLLYQNEWYVANDVLPVTKLSSQTDPRIDVERSSLFLFNRIAGEARQETEEEMTKLQF